MVFLPSTRYGSFSVETSYQPSRSLCSATYLPQSEIRPFSLYDLRAERLALHDVGHGSIRRHHDDRGEPCSGGVGRQRASGIASGRSSQGLGAELFRAGDGGGHAAGLEGAGRIQALVFDVQAIQSHRGAQTLGRVPARSFLRRERRAGHWVALRRSARGCAGAISGFRA